MSVGYCSWSVTIKIDDYHKPRIRFQRNLRRCDFPASSLTRDVVILWPHNIIPHNWFSLLRCADSTKSQDTATKGVISQLLWLPRWRHRQCQCARSQTVAERCDLGIRIVQQLPWPMQWPHKALGARWRSCMSTSCRLLPHNVCPTCVGMKQMLATQAPASQSVITSIACSHQHKHRFKLAESSEQCRAGTNN